MYDHDLRLWYRDLFLHTSRRRPVSGAKARIPRSWDGHVLEADLAAAGHELDQLRNHEQEQSTH